MYLVPRQEVVDTKGISQPGVPQNLFLGLIWAGVAVSFLFLCMRLYSRFKSLRRLFVDDYLAIFAFLLVAATGALWQWASRDMYWVGNVESGIEPFEMDFFDRMHRWLNVTLAVELFFYTSLVTVKLSLLFFFRRLGTNVNHFQWFWWPTLLFTVAIYLISVGTVEYSCLVGSTENIIGECTGPEKKHFITISLQVNCVFDVFSEFMIMVLPIFLLWNVRIRQAKKFAFFGLFSLSLVTMAIATARAADIDKTRRPDGQIDNTYLWLWSAIEPPVAIMVSCLSAFPSLFRSSTSHDEKNVVFTPSETYLRMMSRIRSSRNKSSKNGGKTGDVTLADLSMVSASDSFNYMRAPEAQSQDSQRPVLVSTDTIKHYSANAEDLRDGNEHAATAQSPSRRPDQIMQQFEFGVVTRDPSNCV
ncbi:hypothetical protein B0T17DRAFT_611398 [Bombardia bombarda]|uniref:Rhodopsin domain-containing protein n=1 Tax=Bombardia bombarda TaxID=252184 RepID=A0AA39XI79_9PEZI|nr:hypothetical protein B0T17DRAFT_611398 [Bombardia bombarda]